MGAEQWLGGAMMSVGVCWAVGVSIGKDRWAPNISVLTFTLLNTTWWTLAAWLLVGAPR